MKKSDLPRPAGKSEKVRAPSTGPNQKWEASSGIESAEKMELLLQRRGNIDVDSYLSNVNKGKMPFELSDIIRHRHSGLELSDDAIGPWISMLEKIIVALPAKADAIAAVLGPLLDSSDALKKSLSAASKQAAAKEKRRRPNLPKGLEWPEKDYGASPEAAGEGGILAYLVRVWQPILDAGRRDGRVYVDRRIIADWYPGIVTAIGNYRRPDKQTGQRKEIPENLRFPTVTTITSQALAQGPAAIASDPKLAQVVATRLRRGQPVP